MMTTNKFLFTYAKKQAKRNIIHFLYSLCNELISAYSAYLVGSWLGILSQNYQNIFSDYTIEFLITYVCLNIVSAILEAPRTLNSGKQETMVRDANILPDIFRLIHKHSSAFFNQEMSGYISGQMITLKDRTINFMKYFNRLLSIIIVLPILLIFIYTLNHLFGVVIISLCSICIYLNFRYSKNLKTFSEKTNKLSSQISGIITDSISNHDLIKNNNSLPHEKVYLKKMYNIYLRAKIQEIKHEEQASIYARFSMIAFQILSLVIVFYFWYIQAIGTSAALIVLFLNRQINENISLFNHLLNNLQLEYGSIENCVKTLYKPLEIEDKPNAKKLNIQKNSIEFKNVTFGYPHRKALFKDFNLKIKPNEKVGIVGLSGAGKTTLINLILRCYDIHKGKILISDQDISKVTQYSLHQNIALISQEPCLFNRSIKDNISFSNPNADDTEIQHTAKQAYIHSTIKSLPHGYESVVGERGTKLSGGERQRITIASAILKHAPILILDEATSSLDSDSELHIQMALKNIMKDKTVIAIAHRLSTLKDMDRIIVLDNGKIIENDTPKNLLKNKNGTFYKLYELQSNGYL